MPSPEASAAVDNLVKARTRLTEITKQLKELLARREAATSTKAFHEADRQYAQLQKEWEAAYQEFSQAVKVFSSIVQRDRPPV